MSEVDDIVAVLVGPIAASLPVDFDEGISIEPIPDWMSSDCRNAGLSFEQIKLVLEAKYVVRLKIPSTNDETMPSLKLNGIIEKFTLVGMAFWLSGAAWPLGPVFIFTQDPPPNPPIRTFVSERATNVMGSAESLVDEARINDAKIIFRSLILLDEKSLVRRALKYLTRAVTEDLLDVRYLLDWIVIEALFGTDRSELSFRISQRLSFFIGNGSNKKQIFHQIKKGYDLRSSLVHGMSEGLDRDRNLEALKNIESFIRHAIRKILSGRELLEIFNGETEIRRQFLDGLVFQ